MTNKADESNRNREGAGRGLLIGLAALWLRAIGPIRRKWHKLWWTASVHAEAAAVGRGVHAYGPVYFLGSRRVTLGGNGNLYDNVLFETVEEGTIRVGDRFRINRGCLISAHTEIDIGHDCLIGEYVSIRDNNHRFDNRDTPILDQGYRAEKIVLEDGVWVGRGSAILQGVTLGAGSIIAANSVVTKNVPAGEVWAGVPAKFLRRRGERDSTDS